MSDFHKFAVAIKARFDEMSKGEMFVVNTSGDDVWSLYLASFPEGTNPIYRTRTEHDCSCCKHFIRNIGNVVSIKDGRLQSIWGVEGLEHPFNVVAESLRERVESSTIGHLFRKNERQYGAEETFEQTADGARAWNHFFAKVHDKHFSNNAGEVIGGYGAAVQVFSRGLEELKMDALTTILDLIDSKALYRGEEFQQAVKDFVALQIEYLRTPTELRQNFAWANAARPNSRFRNSAIGTLAQDLSEGVDLEKAVKSFEAKVAPTNYKRPTALITPAMIKQATATIEELGLESALERRYARISDISVNNVLWVDNSVKNQMKGGLESLLLAAVKPAKVDETKARDITMDDFLKTILPKASGLEVFIKNQQQSNFMSLTAPANPDSARLFKWDNGFAWSYDGNIADSDMRKAVQSAGGRVDGAFRFTHSWNYDKRNASLMDLHVFMPGSKVTAESRVNDVYGNNERVGWNNRSHAASGGTQDVDYTKAAPEGYVPVENITFPELSRMPEGVYTCKIHNWRFRSPTDAGFRAEIEFDGQVFAYEYTQPLKDKQWVTVAQVTLKDGKFSINHFLPCSTTSQDKWGVKTETFTKVNTLVLSPNYWDDNATGNKHWFFILDKCVNNQPTRGIYNEFLRSDLEKHRKVFEVLGDKTKCQPTDDQLSGVGFSSTRSDKVLVRVTGDTVGGTFNITF